MSATIDMMFDKIPEHIANAQRIAIIQAENPDGDSLGSALALEDLLAEQGKDVTMYCAVGVPSYLRYFRGWDRVETDFPYNADLYIIVDTSVEILMQKTLEIAGVRHALETHPVVVFDHHNESGERMNFDYDLVLDNSCVATGQLIYKCAQVADWHVTADAAEHMLGAILGDTLGLTTQNVDADTFDTVAALVRAGAKPAELEERRREFMKKPADILAYKGELIQRIEYYLDGKLALVHIPWEDIAQYSDRYNPSVLVMEEMRLVEHVEVACAIKTYPDGKLTGKLRCNRPVAEAIAGYFGGGGHDYSAGFKVYEDYETIKQELLTATDKALTDYDTQASQHTDA